ncbi:NAD-dependent epimerase/dehydratase family protein [Changchengzhania lutea]|uniref:NAD-dependent epimerase/dehydratase family protein n=1 Tax=Changchengzhania lutea TaxID=2049305 RepID=UPI00115C681C|nr:NAD-dependent epimerase/dehydratase family protein [Changchengzhania lutea]
MILVTGGTGLVGAHLLYKLIGNGENVRAIFRNDKKLINVKTVFNTYTQDEDTFFNSIEWFKADLLDIPSLTEAFKGITHVYHCAAFVSFEPDKYHILRKTNIEGTANIVNLCLAFNVEKLCHVSSIATLGTPAKNETITETTHWNPELENSIYAITKYGAEMEIWRGTQEGLDAVIVNPGVIIGAGIWRYGTGALFKRAHHGLSYYTSGTVGLVAVEDVTAIMIQLLKSDIKNERFVLVAKNWTYKTFLQTLATSVGSSPPQKLASPFLLNIAWKLDWLTYKLTGKRRQLTRHLVKSLQSETTYSSNKIETALNYKFKPIHETIMFTGAQFQKSV